MGGGTRRWRPSESTATSRSRWRSSRATTGDQSATNSSAGTMVLPAQTLGAHYRVMTYPQPGPRRWPPPGGPGRRAVAIVGTQPDTTSP